MQQLTISHIRNTEGYRFKSIDICIYRFYLTQAFELIIYIFYLIYHCKLHCKSILKLIKFFFLVLGLYLQEI